MQYAISLRRLISLQLISVLYYNYMHIYKCSEREYKIHLLFHSAIV